MSAIGEIGAKAAGGRNEALDPDRPRTEVHKHTDELIPSLGMGRRVPSFTVGGARDRAGIESGRVLRRAFSGD
jgi:hypothetical protein